jgi:hypothetical protein
LPVCCPCTTTQCSYSAAGGRGCHHLRRLFWPDVNASRGRMIQGGLLALAVNGTRVAGACQRCFSAPCPCGVVGSGAHKDCERLRQHAFWECAIAQAVCTQVQRGEGELCFCSGTCGWLTRLLLPVRWSGGLCCWLLSGQWCRIGNACGLWFIRYLGRGQLCSRPFPNLAHSSGLPCMLLPGMVGQCQPRAGMKPALIIRSCLFAIRFPCARA